MPSPPPSASSSSLPPLRPSPFLQCYADGGQNMPHWTPVYASDLPWPVEASERSAYRLDMLHLVAKISRSSTHNVGLDYITYPPANKKTGSAVFFFESNYIAERFTTLVSNDPLIAGSCLSDVTFSLVAPPMGPNRGSIAMGYSESLCLLVREETSVNALYDTLRSIAGDDIGVIDSIHTYHRRSLPKAVKIAEISFIANTTFDFLISCLKDQHPVGTLIDGCGISVRSAQKEPVERGAVHQALNQFCGGSLPLTFIGKMGDTLLCRVQTPDIARGIIEEWAEDGGAERFGYVLSETMFWEVYGGADEANGWWTSSSAAKVIPASWSGAAAQPKIELASTRTASPVKLKSRRSTKKRPANENSDDDDSRPPTQPLMLQNDFVLDASQPGGSGNPYKPSEPTNRPPNGFQPSFDDEADDGHYSGSENGESSSQIRGRIPDTVLAEYEAGLKRSSKKTKKALKNAHAQAGGTPSTPKSRQFAFPAPGKAPSLKITSILPSKSLPPPATNVARSTAQSPAGPSTPTPASGSKPAKRSAYMDKRIAKEKEQREQRRGGSRSMSISPEAAIARQPTGAPQTPVDISALHASIFGRPQNNGGAGSGHVVGRRQ